MPRKDKLRAEARSLLRSVAGEPEVMWFLRAQSARCSQLSVDSVWTNFTFHVPLMSSLERRNSLIFGELLSKLSKPWRA